MQSQKLCVSWMPSLGYSGLGLRGECYRCQKVGPCARNWHKNMQAWKDLALSMRISLIFLIVLLLFFSLDFML